MTSDKTANLNYLRAQYRLLFNGMSVDHYCADCADIVPVEDWDINKADVSPMPLTERDGRKTIVVIHLSIADGSVPNRNIPICDLPKA